MKLNPSDVTFTYGYHGYTILYKGKPICGNGSIYKNKKLKSNLEFFRQQAKITRRDILNNNTRPDVKLKIKHILHSTHSV